MGVCSGPENRKGQGRPLGVRIPPPPPMAITQPVKGPS